MSPALSLEAYERLRRLIEAERERARAFLDLLGEPDREHPQRSSDSQPPANPAPAQDAPSDFAPTLPRTESANPSGSAIHRMAPASAEHAASGIPLTCPLPDNHVPEYRSAGTSPPHREIAP